jgi:hypothetical protein
VRICTDFSHILERVVDLGGVNVRAPLHAFDHSAFINGCLGCRLSLFQYVRALIECFLQRAMSVSAYRLGAISCAIESTLADLAFSD